MKPLWMGSLARKKGFLSSASHHGKFIAVANGLKRHVTATIAGSASGKKCSPLIIAAGKKVVESWIKPLVREEYTDSTNGPHWITNSDWFSGESCIRCTENGSIDMNTMPFLMNHMSNTIRKYIA